MKCIGLAVQEAKAELTPWEYEVRDLRPNDVEIEIHYCGICHTDVHMMDNDWACSQYPMVPGHEVAGVIARVGSEVKKFKVGDHAGVGCMIWSCRTCDLCKCEQENYCKDVVQTYSFAMPDGEITRGGYANRMVAPEEFTIYLPKEMDMARAAPLLCAGITCWSPMKYFGMDLKMNYGNRFGERHVSSGAEPLASDRVKRIGVIGLGGLGHMAVQFGAKFGADVVVISTSRSKEALARQLGAKDFICINDMESVRQNEGHLDCILDTVSAEKPMDIYLSLLGVNGILVTVGLPEVGIKLGVTPSSLVWKRKMVAGSVVGSIREAEEMVQFCAQNDVYPMVEMVKPQEVNRAITRLKKNDVKFRFVLDFINNPIQADSMIH